MAHETASELSALREILFRVESPVGDFGLLMVMSRLRVRLVLNEGGEGAPLGQIIDISREFEKFLRYLAEDSGIDVGRRDWVARHFENASVRFDVEAPDNFEDAAVATFNRKFQYVDNFDPSSGVLSGEVRHRTLLQYAKAAEALAAHEKVSFGLYAPEGEKPFEYRQLSKLKANELQQRLNQKVKYKTTVQGIIHNIGIEEKYFNLRLRGSGKLLRCDYPSNLYEEVHRASEMPNTLVYVRGLVAERRVDRFVEGMDAVQVRAAPAMPDVFNKVFGQIPDYTGDLTTEEYVDRGWRDNG